MTYKVADGYDVALVSLNDLDPQPMSEGIKPTRRTYAASGDTYEDSLYVELQWNMLESVAQYQSVLTAFGLNNALTNAVTVYVRDATWAFVRMNGVAERPEIGKSAGWDNFFPRRISVLIRDLEDAA